MCIFVLKIDFEFHDQTVMNFECNVNSNRQFDPFNNQTSHTK